MNFEMVNKKSFPKMNLGEWIVEMADTQKTEALRWRSRKDMTFEVAWVHASSSKWRKNHSLLYVEWDKFKGRSAVKRSNKELKATFRCALRSRKYLEEVPEERTKEVRVWRFKPDFKNICDAFEKPQAEMHFRDLHAEIVTTTSNSSVKNRTILTPETTASTESGAEWKWNHSQERTEAFKERYPSFNENEMDSRELSEYFQPDNSCMTSCLSPVTPDAKLPPYSSLKWTDEPHVPDVNEQCQVVKQSHQLINFDDYVPQLRNGDRYDTYVNYETEFFCNGELVNDAPKKGFLDDMINSFQCKEEKVISLENNRICDVSTPVSFYHENAYPLKNFSEICGFDNEQVPYYQMASFTNVQLHGGTPYDIP